MDGTHEDGDKLMEKSVSCELSSLLPQKSVTLRLPFALSGGAATKPTCKHSIHI